MTWYMEEVHLSDQMYFSDQIGRRNKFRFYLRIFFDTLDTDALNSKIIYDKNGFYVWYFNNGLSI